MSKKSPKLFLTGLIVVAVLAALFLGWQRHQVESENKTVGMVLDIADLESIALKTKKPLETVMLDFKGVGATGLLFKEQILDDLGRKVWFKLGSELSSSSSNVEFRGTKESFEPEYTYILTKDKVLAERLAEQLTIKLTKDTEVHFALLDESIYAVGTPYLPRELTKIGVGFPLETIQLAESLDLNIQLQLKSWNFVEADDIPAFFNSFAGVKNLDLIFFSDETLPGFPNKKPLLLSELEKLDVPIAQVEFFNQKGFATVAKGLKKEVVRLHSINAAQMAIMSVPTAVDRFTLAVTERNMRDIFVRLFINIEDPDFYQYNLDYINKIKNSIEKEGFTFGSPKVFESLPYNGALIFLVGLGVIAGGVLLLLKLSFKGWSYLLGILAILGWAGLVVLGRGPSVVKLLALAGVIIYPTLAVTRYLPIERFKRSTSSLKDSILTFLKMSGMSLIGAILMVGLLSDLNYMLKLDQFSGVKFAHLLPLLLIITILYLKTEGKAALKNIVDFLQKPINFLYVGIMGVVLIALAVYTLRTGNEGGSISAVELQFRTILDSILGVRPRTKELLIGHPLMLLTIYLGYRHRLIPLLIFGAIGQISMVNTFAHIHTPLVVSLLRSFHGIWIGIILGVILILVYRILAKFILKLGRDYLHE